MKVDALAQKDWSVENNFVNPPIRLLDKVLDVVRQQKAHATIIAPWWPAQTWFKNLHKMSVCPPIRVYKRAIIPLNPAIPEPLRNRRWKLFVWRVCGNPEHFDRNALFNHYHDCRL